MILLRPETLLLLGRKKTGISGNQMLSLRYPIAWWLSGFGLLLLVATGSLIPGGGVTIGFEHADKIVHALSYFVLIVWFAGLYAKGKCKQVALFLIAFGVLLEFIQARVSYRFFDPLDIIANTGGIVFGLLLSTFKLGGWCQRVEMLLGNSD